MSVLDGWRACPRCSEPLEHGHGGELHCDACGSRYYANSAPCANALPMDDEGRVLLGRRARPPQAGKWDTLGGFLDEGEQPVEGLRRELREESGLEIEPVAFLGAWVDWYSEDGSSEGHQCCLNLSWVVRAVGGEMTPNDDVSELRWFAADELPPPEECAFRTIHDVLMTWRDEYGQDGRLDPPLDQAR